METDAIIHPQTDVAIPPGELLEEELATIGMTQQELATRTGCPIQTIGEIVHGKMAITSATALELERVLGIPAHVWLRLESSYRLAKERLALCDQAARISGQP